MSGRWEGSRRRRQLPPDWAVIRAHVLLRDSYSCTWITADGPCGRHTNQVDHVIPHSQGGTDDQNNLTSLCRAHHLEKSTLEGNQALRLARAKAIRSPRKHPGLI